MIIPVVVRVGAYVTILKIKAGDRVKNLISGSLCEWLAAVVIFRPALRCFYHYLVRKDRWMSSVLGTYDKQK